MWSLVDHKNNKGWVPSFSVLVQLSTNLTSLSSKCSEHTLVLDLKSPIGSLCPKTPYHVIIYAFLKFYAHPYASSASKWQLTYNYQLSCRMQTEIKVEFESSISSKASGYMFGNVRKSTRNRRNIFGNSRDEERKISCVWLSKRLKKLTLYQDAFHMHICLHIATRHNSLQGLNILIKEHFAKNAHQTKRVNRNRKLMCIDRIKGFGLINVPFSLSVLWSIRHEEVMVEYY